MTDATALGSIETIEQSVAKILTVLRARGLVALRIPALTNGAGAHPGA